MPALTSVKYSNNKLKKILTISGIAAGAVALIVTGVILVQRSGILGKKKDTDRKDFKMTSEMSQVTLDSDIHTGYMFSRTAKVLMEDRGTDPWLLSWYIIPGTTRSVPQMQSRYVDSMDQVLLLESYVVDGKRSQAETLMKAIEQDLVMDNGLLRSYIVKEDPNESEEVKAERESYEDPVKLLQEEAPVSMTSSYRYLRALLNYYDKWGNSALLDRIEDLTSKLYASEFQTAYKAADQMARPTPVPVTEKSMVTPIPEEETEPTGVVSLEGIELSSLDLEALRRATVLFPEQKDKFDELVKIVKGGKISDTLPLYAWMYMRNGEYAYYTGSEMNVELVPSLYVMVYLAEIGELDSSGYAWVAEKIYNDGFLNTSYNIISGEASSEEEASEAYPLVLYLSIIKEDDALFEATYSAMMRHYATLDSSQALYTFFRDVENSRVAVFARENLLMKLILR